MDDGTMYTTVGHRGMWICNPIGGDQLDEVVGLVAPNRGHAIDLGCGKGELLIRLAETARCRGTGLDRNAVFIAQGRAAAEARAPGLVDLIEVDVTAYPLAAEAYDVAAAVGASHVLGGTAATLAALTATTRPDGFVVLGDGFWRRPPDDDALVALGMGQGDLMLLPELVAAVGAAGLEPLHVAVARDDDWDRYEWAHLRNLEAHAREHPDDEQAGRLWARRRGWRDAYLRAGRELMGFALIAGRRRRRG